MLTAALLATRGSELEGGGKGHKTISRLEPNKSNHIFNKTSYCDLFEASLRCEIN